MSWHPHWTRRQLLIAGAVGLAAGARPNRAGAAAAPRSFAEIERRVGGRVGVYALDTGSGRELQHRPDERFAMCSTFKWVLAAAVLVRVDRGELALDDRLQVGPADLLEYAPAVRQHLAEGSMTIAALARAAVVVSDNTAANLLLAEVGGPAGLTEILRSEGDAVTRLDRYEPALNDNDPGDPRDTTSPRAMVGLMRRFLCGDALSAGSRELLLSWLRACDTGKDRLRAGLPSTWIVGDKTGTGRRGAVNDVAIAEPSGGAPILLAAYLSDSDASLALLAAAQADIGRLVGVALAPRTK